MIGRSSCSLHNEGNILEGLRDGHIFYASQCVPENLVYDDKVVAFPITPPEIMMKAKKEAYLIFEPNFTKALDFHVAAARLHESHNSLITVFLLHQAAELTFRGILQSLNGYEKRTNEIKQLKKYVRRCAPQLCGIFAEDAEEDSRLLEVLDNAYNYARYGNDYQISEGDLAVLFKKVTLLLDTAKSIAHSILAN